MTPQVKLWWEFASELGRWEASLYALSFFPRSNTFSVTPGEANTVTRCLNSVEELFSICLMLKQCNLMGEQNEHLVLLTARWNTAKQFVPVVRWILVNLLCLKHSAPSAALQVHLHAASPVLGTLLLPCQTALQFSLPNLKAELLKLCLSPRHPSSRSRGGHCPVPPPHHWCCGAIYIVQLRKWNHALNETIAVLVLTSSGGEDGCPQVPGVTPIQAVGAVWMCGCCLGLLDQPGFFPFSLLAGMSCRSVPCLSRRTGRQF